MAGMMTRLAPTSAMLMLLAISATAQEDYVEPQIDQTRLYVSNPAACKALEDQSVDAFGELDFLALSFDRGIEGMEFNCRFFDVKSQKGNRFLFVDAVCEAPDEVYPDTMSISPYDETQIRVVSTYDSMLSMAGDAVAAADDPDGFSGTTLYTRCDNLSEIPVD
jgi:hypothetical protein